MNEQKNYDFTQLKAVAELKELAKKPIDLTTDLLTPSRIEKMKMKGGDLTYLFGTERVDEETLKAFEALAQESQAVAKMKKVQSGEVMNRIEGYPSEERQVLHTAMRDLFGQEAVPAPAETARQFARKEHQKLQAFLEKIEGENRFDTMVMVGIGGSDLGPQAVYIALAAHHLPGKKVVFISNVDPDHQAIALKGVGLKRTLVGIISKSGTTLETLTNEMILREKFQQAGLNPKEHFIAITEENSQMDNPEAYLERFHMKDYVGGRYSVFSMVGVVSLSFGVGYSVVKDMLKGAYEMDRLALSERLQDNLPLFAALVGIWNRTFLKHHTLAVIPYSQLLARLPAHLQQLDMESNGKSIDCHGRSLSFDSGPIVFGEPGTNGQHSFFQLLHQGTTVVPIEFIGFKESACQDDLSVQGTHSQQKLLANLFAQSLALATGQKSDNPNKRFQGNRPTHIVMAKRLTPHTLGQLISYYEHKVAFQGLIWGINSFDQEGVQLGKVLATKILDAMKQKSEYPLGQALLNHVDAL